MFLVSVDTGSQSNVNSHKLLHTSFLHCSWRSTCLQGLVLIKHISQLKVFGVHLIHFTSNYTLYNYYVTNKETLNLQAKHYQRRSKDTVATVDKNITSMFCIV